MIELKKSHLLLSITSVKSEQDDYWFRVLDICCQDNPSHFGVEFPSWSFTEFEYLDSGTYSHVIKAIGVEYNYVPLVFKIIKVVDRNTMTRFSALSFNGFELYSDVYQEIVITKVLSNLHNITCDAAGYEYQTHCFPRIYCTKIVHGSIPNYFIVRKYDENNPRCKPVERFDDVFGVPREHLAILMKYCGDSVWHLAKHRHKMTSKGVVGITADQLLSVCYQVTLALAVAECIYEFEHRDLHVCNILVKHTKKPSNTFVIRSVTYRCKSFGVKACIIDATFSRVCLGPNVYFTDLSNRLKGTASNPNPDAQEEAYQHMYNTVVDRWRDWFPVTNIFWCKYFYNEVANSEAFMLDCTESTRRNLQHLINSISQFTTLTDFVQNMFHSGSNTRVKGANNVRKNAKNKTTHTI